MDAQISSSNSPDQSPTERLGSPELLAATAHREFTRRTFAGRHPILTFLAAPLPAVVLAIVFPCLVLAGCHELIKWLGDVPADQHVTIISPFWDALILFSFVGFERIVPFVLCTWFFLRLARRAGRPAWGFAACTVVILFATCFTAWATPAVGPERAKLFLGAGLYAPQFRLWSGGLLQAAVPSALTLAAWLRLRRSHNRPTALPQG
ncbi:MAG: hypothetical protein U0903_01335 [Planctomycetales bacterium]